MVLWGHGVGVHGGVDISVGVGGKRCEENALGDCLHVGEAGAYPGVCVVRFVCAKGVQHELQRCVCVDAGWLQGLEVHGRGCGRKVQVVKHMVECACDVCAVGQRGVCKGEKAFGSGACVDALGGACHVDGAWR